MKIPSVNISPRVQCGKTAGKTRVSVTQLNSKLHCRDFVRMGRLVLEPVTGGGGFGGDWVELFPLHTAPAPPAGGNSTGVEDQC